MNGVAIASPILPGRLDEWIKFGRNLDEGPKHNDYAAFIKKSGLSRVRCWLQKGPGPDDAVGIILYEGENPAGFLQQIGTSQEPFAVWFRERVKKNNGMDLAAMPKGPPPELITDVSAA